MSWNGPYSHSPGVTPFIPPLPSPGGGSVRSPQIPNPQTQDLPDWATQPQSMGQYPMFHPGSGGPPGPGPGPGYGPIPQTPAMHGHNTPFIPPGPHGMGNTHFGTYEPPGSYFPPPTGLPPQTPYVGHGGGFSTDYTGYPSAAGGYPGPAGPGPGMGHLGTPWPSAPPTHHTPYTPFHPPMHPGMGHPGTAYNAFQTPLPGGGGGGGPPGWGPPAGYGGGAGPGPQTPWGQGMPGMPGAFGTPWTGGAQLPGGGGGGGGGGPRPGAHRAGMSFDFHRTQDDGTLHEFNRWAPGLNYAPVLDAFLVKAVDAQVILNPLLAPPEDSLERPYLKWNMLFQTNTCQRSIDRQGRSWTAGRDEPATFPRVTDVRIVCRHLPWLIEIKARDPEYGVTCGELIDGVGDSMYRHVSKDEMMSAGSRARQISSTYYRNRSSDVPDVPGGRLGDGVRRVDWLMYNTSFEGIQRNDQLVRAQSGGIVLPCTFELKCGSRFTPDEEILQRDRDRAREERDARGERMSRTHSRAGSARSRTASSRSRSAPRFADEEDEDDEDE